MEEETQRKKERSRQVTINDSLLAYFLKEVENTTTSDAWGRYLNRLRSLLLSGATYIAMRIAFLGYFKTVIKNRQILEELKGDKISTTHPLPIRPVKENDKLSGLARYTASLYFFRHKDVLPFLWYYFSRGLPSGEEGAQQKKDHTIISKVVGRDLLRESAFLDDTTTRIQQRIRDQSARQGVAAGQGIENYVTSLPADVIEHLIQTVVRWRTPVYLLDEENGPPDPSDEARAAIREAIQKELSTLLGQAVQPIRHKKVAPIPPLLPSYDAEPLDELLATEERGLGDLPHEWVDVPFNDREALVTENSQLFRDAFHSQSDVEEQENTISVTPTEDPLSEERQHLVFDATSSVIDTYRLIRTDPLHTRIHRELERVLTLFSSKRLTELPYRVTNRRHNLFYDNVQKLLYVVQNAGIEYLRLLDALSEEGMEVEDISAYLRNHQWPFSYHWMQRYGNDRLVQTIYGNLDHVYASLLAIGRLKEGEQPPSEEALPYNRLVHTQAELYCFVVDVLHPSVMRKLWKHLLEKLLRRLKLIDEPVIDTSYRDTLYTYLSHTNDVLQQRTSHTHFHRYIDRVLEKRCLFAPQHARMDTRTRVNEPRLIRALLDEREAPLRLAIDDVCYKWRDTLELHGTTATNDVKQLMADLLLTNMPSIEWYTLAEERRWLSEPSPDVCWDRRLLHYFFNMRSVTQIEVGPVGEHRFHLFVQETTESLTEAIQATFPQSEARCDDLEALVDAFTQREEPLLSLQRKSPHTRITVKTAKFLVKEGTGIRLATLLKYLETLKQGVGRLIYVIHYYTAESSFVRLDPERDAEVVYEYDRLYLFVLHVVTLRMPLKRSTDPLAAAHIIVERTQLHTERNWLEVTECYELALPTLKEKEVREALMGKISPTALIIPFSVRQDTYFLVREEKEAEWGPMNEGSFVPALVNAFLDYWVLHTNKPLITEEMDVLSSLLSSTLHL
jgi:hypothetical protein